MRYSEYPYLKGYAMKISSRAFNNILIFSMLAMIMLFNMDTWLPKPGGAEKMALIAEQDLVLRIDIDGARLERVGTQWRLIDSSASHVPEDIVNAWLSAELAATEFNGVVNTSVFAQVWLAGYPQPAGFTLIQSPHGSFVRISDSTYRIENVDFSALVF